jgi:PadR family transcriptional regulator, regulatory protein PadR
MIVWESELRRGVVEMSLLAVIKEKEAYGYEIIERLKENSSLTLTESTVYPILARLAKEGLLATRQAQSPSGPPRRYFRLTAKGLHSLSCMVVHWQVFKKQVSHLVEDS